MLVQPHGERGVWGGSGGPQGMSVAWGRWPALPKTSPSPPGLCIGGSSTARATSTPFFLQETREIPARLSKISKFPRCRGVEGETGLSPENAPPLWTVFFSFLLLLPDLYKGLLMTCEDILISQVPAVHAEEAFSAEGNFVFRGGMERKLDTKAPAELSCCAKCSLFWIWSTFCFGGALYLIYLFPVVVGSLLWPLPVFGIFGCSLGTDPEVFWWAESSRKIKAEAWESAWWCSYSVLWINKALFPRLLSWHFMLTRDFATQTKPVLVSPQPSFSAASLVYTQLSSYLFSKLNVGSGNWL